jgi:hypothetical protein
MKLTSSDIRANRIASMDRAVYAALQNLCGKEMLSPDFKQRKTILDTPEIY